jgi:hypothetical protein
MTIFEKFHQCVEQSSSDQYAFTADERRMIDQRVAVAKPEFASSKKISKIFGKRFSA